ncbi:hypothetical protein GOP47_0016591 [Adiantum capillus-veneris]|uniref:Uncharacterized protein n=1 Tax=Adiantum capillus-veneris TaxID=13818 RepID=A0A9D4ZD48_ADICA|nr:hypothetical protein GOP47_0016591 [Adiantum capillus-veneris]
MCASDMVKILGYGTSSPSAAVGQNEEKTALDRWLHCLQISFSSNAQDAEADPFQIGDELSPERFIEPLDVELTESKDILVANKWVLVEGEENTGSSKHFIELKEVELSESKDILVANTHVFGEGEGNKGALVLDKQIAKDQAQIETARFQEEDILLSWLKLNFTILAVCRLLFGLFKRCNWKMEFSEPSMMSLPEDSLEAVPEISKSIIVDNSPSTNHSATANLRMLGSSLGSAIGAVFSEVLLKSCSSGSPVPADKICMILESALKDLTLQVQEDDCCSKLIGDFIAYFKSTYTTMYRIHQACASYGGPGVTDSYLNEVNKSSIVKSTCEDCRSAKSCMEENHIERMDFDDNTWQVKEELSFGNGSGKNKQISMKSSTVLAVNAMPESSECLRSLAKPGECDLAASAFDDDVVESNMKTEMHIPSCGRIDDPFEETLLCASAELTDEIVTHLDYEVEDASSVCEEPSSMMQSNAVGRLNTPLVGHSHVSRPSEYQKVFLRFYGRHVQAQEQHNKFKYMKLQRLAKQQTLDEEKIQLASAANGLMRENIDLGRSKASFKENRVLDQQTKDAHAKLCTTCADELAAGLCVMLTTLVYSVRMYSFTLLNDLVSMCQPAGKEPRRSVGIHIDWFYNSLDSVAGRLQAIVCQLTVTGRILVGSILVGIVAQSLLRRSVTNSSQAMPATILIIVLGGVCGFIGKVSVDSLGGSGARWLLHGSPSGVKSKIGPPFWLRRLAFHSTLVLFLPILAGLLPFGTFSCVVNDLLFTSIESLGGIVASISGWAALSIQK